MINNVETRGSIGRDERLTMGVRGHHRQQTQPLNHVSFCASKPAGTGNQMKRWLKQ